VRLLFSGSITSEIIFGIFVASFVEYLLSGHCYNTIHQLQREKVCLVQDNDSVNHFYCISPRV